jgi:hypothetical protein
MILGFPKSGNACALNIPMHEQYPFGSLNQNNLAHVVGLCIIPPILEKYIMDQCIFEITYKG